MYIICFFNLYLHCKLLVDGLVLFCFVNNIIIRNFIALE